MKKTTLSNNDNILFEIHANLGNAFIVFRDQVCAECSWSIPTFYRKMRCNAAISKAEKAKIFESVENILTKALETTQKLRQRLDGLHTIPRKI